MDFARAHHYPFDTTFALIFLNHYLLTLNGNQQRLLHRLTSKHARWSGCQGTGVVFAPLASMHLDSAASMFPCL